MSAFTSIELGKDPKELQAGDLSLQKNPLLVSIIDGCETLKALVGKTKITSDHISSAKGLILMSANKIGFGVSITQGHGLVIIRNANTSSGCVGAVMGYSEQKTLLLLTSEEEISVFLNDKRTLKLGLDLGLNVGKKLNENKHMDSSQLKKDEAGEKAFTVSKGYIVDVSLKGTSVEPDADDIAAAYGEGTTPADVLQGRVKPPRQAQLLYNALAALQDKAAATPAAAAAAAGLALGMAVI
ncbi:hypothetical protein COO60DRAFT_257962 [Scenedesmus sp. NREL 46B-D3]|nr:hypothetical protein COO60DRAFT_257962 [Scenedesmus sp. NREL 46B-D3]